MIKALGFLALLASSNVALAQTCILGGLGEDNRIEVNVSRKAITVNLHELSFTASGTDVVRNGGSMAILDKNLTLSGEGETFKAKVNALFVYDATKKTMAMTLLTDGMVQAAVSELACK